MEIPRQKVEELKSTGRYGKLGCAVTAVAYLDAKPHLFMVKHTSQDANGVSRGQWGPVSETCKYTEDGGAEDGLTTALRALHEEVGLPSGHELWVPRIEVPPFDWPMGTGRLATFAVNQFLHTNDPGELLRLGPSSEIMWGEWVPRDGMDAFMANRTLRSGVQEWYAAISGVLPEVFDAIEAGDGYEVTIPEVFPAADDIRFEDTTVGQRL